MISLYLYVWYAYMFIAKGVSFVLPAGKRIGTVQLAGNKRAPLKNRSFKFVHFFISI